MLSILLAFISLFLYAASAQTPSPTSTPDAASVLRDTATYGYIGCYNETTGNPSVGHVRALKGGSMFDSDTMTVEQCLAFCGQTQYAGLEYGRECWCAAMLNAFAPKQADADCSLTCTGDETQLCGGSLTLTTYQRKAGTKSNGHRCIEMGNSLALAAITLACFCVAL